MIERPLQIRVGNIHLARILRIVVVAIFTSTIASTAASIGTAQLAGASGSGASAVPGRQSEKSSSIVQSGPSDSDRAIRGYVGFAGDWFVDPAGHVGRLSSSDAFYGEMSPECYDAGDYCPPSTTPHLAAPIVGMAATSDMKGYWLVGADGGVFAFGDAPFLGSASNLKLNAPIVAMHGTPSGHGYWLVGADGGVFAYGDARFLGSASNFQLATQVDGIAVSSDGMGYWLVAKDGGVFAYGDAQFYGSMGGRPLADRVVGMSRTSDGLGYFLVGADGGLFAFGDASFAGSLIGSQVPPGFTIGIAVNGVDGASGAGSSGYWFKIADGSQFTIN